ncbi:hypothetical protein P167DRAFT_540401 [Morchella conica CCBAS932]|uniref:Uncharacterized protein n=1 Tax=Morchella conica CCBAS932 TaxID=1392247 RepID=A0A3N4KCE9_9PEZI|nr:hypothetical protein P167DRAFT_540401 [Morchella conica CCBAS932]
MVNDQPHEHGEKEDKPAVIISFDKILIASGALVCATGAIVFIAVDIPLSPFSNWLTWL